jgi:endonuclease-3 related protein
MVGAILTQNTAWTNVEKAVANLRAERALTPRGLLALPPRRLARTIRPSGYFNQKARRLRGFTHWYLRQFGGSPARMRRVPLPRLREDLLALKGIGPETADSILLYALDKPVFVVDAYTRRIGERHGLMADGASYDEVQATFEAALPRRATLYNDYHAQVVVIGKDFCRKRAPRCGECPWRGDLPWVRPR